MTSLLQELKKTNTEGNHYFVGGDIRAKATEVFTLANDGLLAVWAPTTHDAFLCFAVFGWIWGTESGDAYDLVFHGEGVPGLRELRHTYWGEGGYLFYPDAELITSAFVVLRRWFDSPNSRGESTTTPDCYTYHEWDCLMDGTLSLNRQNHMLECRKCSGQYIRYIKADRQ